ncbi:MAG TPA: hypothetical protein VFZ79_19760 [Acidimicrobiales bacterium]
MTDSTADDVIGVDEASELLEVPPAQIGVLVDDGVLTRVDDGVGGTGFSRAEVMAARLMGG